MPLIWLVVSILVLVPALQSEAQSPPPAYNAISNRNLYPYPPLPSLGGAGYQFSDPTFGSKIVRVTDGMTRPDLVQAVRDLAPPFERSAQGERARTCRRQERRANGRRLHDAADLRSPPGPTCP